MRNRSVFSENQFGDESMVLGGETGLRGFPIMYLHGQHSTQFSLEARYYPNINIYKLFELGAAAFIDTGKVLKQNDDLQNTPNSNDWNTSIGLGARFYSTQTSEGRVIRIDIIKPITDDINVNNGEFRVTTKYSF